MPSKSTVLFSIKNILQSHTRLAAQILFMLLFPLPLNHKWFKMQQRARLRTTVQMRAAKSHGWEPSRGSNSPEGAGRNSPPTDPSSISTACCHFLGHLQNPSGVHRGVWHRILISLTGGAASIPHHSWVQHRIHGKSEGAHWEEEDVVLKCLVMCSNVHPRF